jgi:porphobilinogen synthase
MISLTRRPRRLRDGVSVRRMVRETRLLPDDFVYPMFVDAALDGPRAIEAMPGQHRHSLNSLVEAAGQAWEAGVPAVILFGIPPEDRKDPYGSYAEAEDSIVARAVRALREALPELVVMCDICLCEYTDHGHCGYISEGRVLNDPSVDALARQALACARAGAQWVAPSDMMDGRVGAIREALDAEGHTRVGLMAYSVKYASAYYGPFREAAGSAPSFGDRRAYQMDPGNVREGLVEAELDEAEGADILMVKPALAYLDVVARLREQTLLPVAAYNVSGEYSMLKAAAERGLIDGDRVMMESLTAMRRAGADLILTYHAVEAARLLAAGA